MPRFDGRQPEELRPVEIRTHFVKHPDGSALIEWGDTRVICSASIDESVPPFLRNSGKGWLTAEYSMLPGSSRPRIARKVGGRTQEIQRLIGRSLRAVLNLDAIGERTIQIDCDVIQADGGTRTASITGAYVALVLAVRRAIADGRIQGDPLIGAVAAVSVGIVDDQPLVDLCYAEDSRAEVDMNLVMTGAGEFVEVQGTAEGKPFNRKGLDRLLELGGNGISQLLEFQRQVLAR